MISISRPFCQIKTYRAHTFWSSLCSLISILCFILSLFLSVIEPSPLYAKSPTFNVSDDLRVHFIDIGQGDAALIESPTGKKILIDSGPSKSWSSLKKYLQTLKINQIDLMINSHPHADHIGNAARIIKDFNVKQVLDSGYTHPIKAYRDLLDVIQERKVSLKLGRKGRKIRIGGGAYIELLGPQDPLIKGSRSDPNSNSIIFRLTYREASFLFTGDAEEETEERLLQIAERLPAQFLKVAHHGSSHASSQRFLSAVSPKFAVISCSQSNRYGHPAPETLHRLKQRGVDAWITAKRGTLVVKTDGKRWFFNQKEHRLLSGAHSADSAHTHPSPPSPNHPQHTESSSSGDKTLININTATAQTLTQLPGVGKKLSQRIIKDREENGHFQSLEDVRRVKGIGAKTAQKMSTLIRFK